MKCAYVRVGYDFGVSYQHLEMLKIVCLFVKEEISITVSRWAPDKEAWPNPNKRKDFNGYEFIVSCSRTGDEM